MNVQIVINFYLPIHIVKCYRKHYLKQKTKEYKLGESELFIETILKTKQKQKPSKLVLNVDLEEHRKILIKINDSQIYFSCTQKYTT